MLEFSSVMLAILSPCCTIFILWNGSEVTKAVDLYHTTFAFRWDLLIHCIMQDSHPKFCAAPSPGIQFILSRTVIRGMLLYNIKLCLVASNGRDFNSVSFICIFWVSALWDYWLGHRKGFWPCRYCASYSQQIFFCKLSREIIEGQPIEVQLHHLSKL